MTDTPKPKRSAKLPTYEYRILNQTGKPEDIEETLNSLGKESWDIHIHNTIISLSSISISGFAKREVK